MFTPHLLPTFILTTIFLTFHIPPSISQQYEPNCTILYTCGQTFQPIGYPFSGQDRHPSCGLPGFQLRCNNSENTTTITINSQVYRVLQTDNYDRTITLSRDNTCSESPSVERDLNDTLFGYSNDDVQFLDLYRFCPPNFSILDKDTIRCGGAGSVSYLNESFVLEDKRMCQISVAVPVNRTLVGDLEGRDGMSLEELIGSGVRVEYKYDAGACLKCLDSDGVCWSGTNSSRSSCICTDGVRYGDCSAKEKPNVGLKIGIGVGAGVFGILATSLAFFFYHRRKKNGYKGTSYVSRGISSRPSSTRDLENDGIYLGVHIFKYSELEKATNYFDAKKELGDGGFGTVYQGKLKDGRTVAVKRLYENNYKRVEQFMNEVEILTRLRHQNLVALYGCTSHHGRELLLVYEYIPNGTVADHLHGDHAKPGSLPWTTRMSIAVETASALAYLHASDVIHRDVKTNNILLDSNFCVKVADFGLSRLFPNNVTHVSMAPQGTPGYVDPEYHECYQLTSKSDVFSFGVVLIELISSQPAVDITRHRHEINLSNMAINKIRNDALDELVDRSIGYDSDYTVRKMINAVAELAFRCLQNDREMRPSMAEVLEILKDIQSEDKKSKKPGESDIPGEKAVLCKNIPQTHSPDSVAATWNSSSTASGEARLNFTLKPAIGIGAGLFEMLTSCIVLYKLTKKFSSSASRTFPKWKPAPDDKVEVFILQYGASIPQRYRYSDIRKMTNSFKDELGEGGYGKVFKGKLDDDRLVAVKVLNESKGSGEEFINEVSSIGKTSHVNIVSLFGFCYEGKERALVYEFMPNGSLEKFINHKISEESAQHLRVEKLYDIAVGIARGLEYLHHGCATRILHFDIKPHNILLDKDFCPKISDFGLAKIHSRNESIVSMQEEARGTIGYIAPEVFYRNFGGVSHKSDVYSYGMMVLEMVCGKKNINARANHSSEIYFPQWIYKQLELDEDLQLQQGQIPIVENEIARKMIIVGLWCIQTYPSQRPSIKKVIEMLEGTIEAMQIPPNTFYSSPPHPQVTSSITPDILSLE